MTLSSRARFRFRFRRAGDFHPGRAGFDGSRDEGACRDILNQALDAEAKEDEFLGEVKKGRTFKEMQQKTGRV